MTLIELEMCDAHEVVSSWNGYTCRACGLRGTLWDLFSGPIRCKPHSVFKESGWHLMKHQFNFAM